MWLLILFSVFFFFFKQKTAYEMRISDWSSDVCSSDLVFHAVDFVAQGIYARVGGHGIFVIGGGEPSENQWHGHHVLDAVVTIGRIVQRTFFVDDAQAGFVGADRQICDVVGGFAVVS